VRTYLAVCDAAPALAGPEAADKGARTREYVENLVKQGGHVHPDLHLGMGGGPDPGFPERGVLRDGPHCLRFFVYNHR